MNAPFAAILFSTVHVGEMLMYGGILNNICTPDFDVKRNEK